MKVVYGTYNRGIPEFSNPYHFLSMTDFNLCIVIIYIQGVSNNYRGGCVKCDLFHYKDTTDIHFLNILPFSINRTLLTCLQLLKVI